MALSCREATPARIRRKYGVFQSGWLAPLTARERDILGLLTERLTDVEIGERLSIGRCTVEFHVANIIGKLGVTNRREAAALASRLGVV